MPDASPDKKLPLTFCFGTSCFLRGARELYAGLMDYVRDRGVADRTEFRASFCSERCQRGPVLTVGETVLERCTVAAAAAEIDRRLGLPRESEQKTISGGDRNA